MISIGSVLKGPQLPGSPIDVSIMKATKAAVLLRGNFSFGSGMPAVHVVFYVPGSTGNPDWDGLRDSKYSQQQKLLMVQVSVPDFLVGSPESDDYAIDSLHGANAVAFEYFRQRNITFPLREAEELVSRIGERLKEHG